MNYTSVSGAASTSDSKMRMNSKWSPSSNTHPWHVFPTVFFWSRNYNQLLVSSASFMTSHWSEKNNILLPTESTWKEKFPNNFPCLKAKWKSRSNMGVPHCLLVWGHDHTSPSSHWHFWPIMINTKKKGLCEVWWNTFKLSHLLWSTFEGCFQNSCQIQYRSS